LLIGKIKEKPYYIRIHSTPIHTYLKNIQPDKENEVGRLDKFKEFLKNRDIPFEDGLFT